ncbi:MAG: hypothetical protein KF685_08490 [Acidobacteria bacterium]|nr:hypothetical protein [Acidobacteriota bacterium]
MAKSILLQTTIPFSDDDWNIRSFSMLAEHLSSLRDENGYALYDVSARNREARPDEADPVLSKVDGSDIDQIWLFALDNGDGLSVEDCEAITRFRQRGGGLLTVRDHNDMGSSLCSLSGVGAAHYFHSKQQEPDDSRHQRDDAYTLNVDWPNYHSGANGDYQKIEVVSNHELLLRSDGSLLEYFPSHPHEGAIGAPDPSASVIATGKSLITGRDFNLVVAFEKSTDEHGNRLGRAIAESSFHHFVDYNWDTDRGCPPFISEPPGDGYKRNPERLNDIKHYVANAARWLA